MKQWLTYILLCLVPSGLFAQDFKGKVTDEDGKGIPAVELICENSGFTAYTDPRGNFKIASEYAEGQKVIVYKLGFHIKEVHFKSIDSFYLLSLQPLTDSIETVVIEKNRYQTILASRLQSIEGTAIYSAKKNDVIMLDNKTANKATANARQLFAKVPGLNIWESDNAGLQLGIGVRGLSPNRTSNFNTRQNGYDISADALGYPESYYTPPADAIERIEVVRGASSLQYGTQFGGLLNFKLKDAPDKKKFTAGLRSSIGSFGLQNRYIEIGGRQKKVSYFTYGQLKSGIGYRDNSDFDRRDAYVKIGLHPNNKLDLSFEYTGMNYLAQQAGGLTKRLFEQDPTQSLRERNWFSVNWNLAALKANYRFNTYTQLSSTTFALKGGRNALGYLGSTTTADPLGNRDLLMDDYLNFGNETRLLHKMKTGSQYSAILLGMRAYKGATRKRQGDGNSGYGPDFEYLNPNNLERSDFRFPSSNLALFSEASLNLHPKLNITPGIRYEWIETAAKGTFREIRTNLAGDTIYDQSTYSETERRRDFILFGIGISYKPKPWMEIYGNISQNYRAINFNDLKIVNPNFKIDPNLQDETGYNADLGIRGTHAGILNYDFSMFHLSYNNKIGFVLKENQELFNVYRLRTNISDARIVGFEGLMEADLLRFCCPDAQSSLSLFTNVTWLQGQYLGSQEAAFAGKTVELVPEWMLRTGVNYRANRFKASVQYSYTGAQFTDATNALETANAIHGLVPSYHVIDLSISYQYNWLTVSTGLNNLTNNRYFTRRAVGYPGPGIIPGDGRNYYLTLGATI